MNHFSPKRAAWAVVGILVLVGSLLASAAVANAQVLARTGGPTVNKHYPPGVVGCNSIASCNAALANPSVKKVLLEADITGVVGNGVVIGSNNKIFDGQGHKIMGTTTVAGSGDIGINGRFRNNVVIRNVAVSMFDMGITTELSSNAKILNTKTYSNYGAAVLFGGGSNYEVADNDISNNYGQAISGWNADKVLLENNYVYQNNLNLLAPTSVDLSVISNAKIDKNTFKINNYGVMITNGVNNDFYHNNFIGNGIDVQEIGGGNSWFHPYDQSNPKIGGGNFWFDLNGPCTDNFDGPVTPQTSGSPDGICDAAHTNGVTDNFPFVSENGWA